MTLGCSAAGFMRRFCHMQTEIEAKFTDIDVEKIRQLLRETGAIRIHPERLMRRKNFEWPNHEQAWVRVRDEGDKVTMAYKRCEDRTLHGTKEVEITIDDFDRGCELLEAVGVHAANLQETKRERWEFNGCEVTIDTWPWVPSFLEVEGPTEEMVRDTAAKLACEWDKAMHGSVETVYQQHYEVTEDEINAWETITFIPVPEWLEKKRKHV